MPPFARAKGGSILKGVNYASGSTGIRDESGSQLYIATDFSSLLQGVRIPLKEQVYNTSRQYTPQQYAAALVEQYSQQIKVLYRLGARKFALYGLGLLGCTPIAISVYGTNGARCVDKIKHCLTNGTCCKVGGSGGELCIRNSKPCSDRSRYVFWDAIHPSDAWNELVAKIAYRTNSTKGAHPCNIQTLAKLK
ncbi:hypothetical protein POUND7_010040 [Theobroma cacao]